MLHSLRERRVAGSAHARRATAAAAAADDLAPRLTRTGELVGHTGCVNTVTWVGEDRLLTGSDDLTVRLWRASDGVPLWRLATAHSDNIFQVRGRRAETRGCAAQSKPKK